MYVDYSHRVCVVIVLLVGIVAAILILPQAHAQGLEEPPLVPHFDFGPAWRVGSVNIVPVPEPIYSSPNVMLSRLGYEYTFWFMIKPEQYAFGEARVLIDGPCHKIGDTWPPSYYVSSVTDDYFNTTRPGQPPMPGDQLSWDRADLPFWEYCDCYWIQYTIYVSTLGVHDTMADHRILVYWEPGGATGRSLDLEWRPFRPRFWVHVPFIAR